MTDANKKNLTLIFIVLVLFMVTYLVYQFHQFKELEAERFEALKPA